MVYKGGLRIMGLGGILICIGLIILDIAAFIGGGLVEGLSVLGIFVVCIGFFGFCLKE